MMDIAIDAPPAAVWELVRDPRRLPESSPQVLETSLITFQSERFSPGCAPTIPDHTAWPQGRSSTGSGKRR